MSAQFYLFLPLKVDTPDELLLTEFCWVFADVNNELKLVRGLPEDAAKAALNYSVTLILPGEDVLYLSATVPGKNLQQVQQAVPYVLEDNVIDDVDELHFAISKKNTGDNEYDVAVINEQYFNSIVTQLGSLGIQLDRVIADYFLLQPKTLFSDGTRLLCNCEDTKFSLLPGKHLKLTELGMSKNDIDKLVYCHPEPSSENNLSAYKDELEIEIEQSPIQPYLYLVKNCPAAPGINLLQGAYRKKKNWSKAGKAWMPAAAAFLIWLLVEGVMFVADYISLSNQSHKLNEQMVQIYKSTFPGARNISNPRARMESQLLSLKKRKGQNGRGFTEMLSGSAAIFANTPGLKIKTMRYYDGRINLELKVASLQALDKLKLQLINEQGYQVEIQNASSDKENVSARIQITGAAS